MLERAFGVAPIVRVAGRNALAVLAAGPGRRARRRPPPGDAVDQPRARASPSRPRPPRTTGRFSTSSRRACRRTT